MNKIILFLIALLIYTPLFSKTASPQRSKPTKTTEKTVEQKYPDGWGIGYALIPGVVVHGLGHYLTGEEDTGTDLMIAEAISVGGIATFGVPLALTANAGVLAPVILPGLFFSGTLFVATWLLDLLGVTGLSEHLIEDHPLSRKTVAGGYLFQEDLQSPHHHFLNLQAHLSFGDHMIDLNIEHTLNSGYHRTACQYGYALLNTPGMKLYLIPEFKYERDSEGFAISTAMGYIRFDLNLNHLWPTLKHIYLVSLLGYGTQWYHFNGFDLSDNQNSLLTIGQGLRLRFPMVGIESMMLHQKDEQIGGTGVTLTIFKHTLTLHHKQGFIKFQWTHGQGYRFGTLLGWEL